MKKPILKFLLTTALITLIFSLSSCGHTHTYGAWGEDSATCTEPGEHSRTCKTCGSVQTSKTNPKGHDMQHMYDCDPTCTEPGYSHNCLKCTRCDLHGGVIIDALGHHIVKYDDAEANCTQNGYEDYEECTVCDYSSGTKIAAHGHSMSEWFGDSATCSRTGIEFSECSKCDYYTYRDTVAKGHVLEDGQCSICGQSDVLVLIENGKANFTVVHSSYSGSTGKILADSLVERLRELGITVNDAVSDADVSTENGCEIIIGAEVRSRGDEYCVTEHYLGREGEIIKRVDNSVVVAGSTSAILRSVFEKFTSEYLGITESTEEVRYASFDGFESYEKITKYPIDNIIINSIPITSYSLVLDYEVQMTGYSTEHIDSFINDLYAVSGYRLKTVTSSNIVSSGKYIIIRYADYAGDEGFRAYVRDSRLIIECAYKNMFDEAFYEFASEIFYSVTGDVVLLSDFSYEKTVNTVYYKDFGANGDDELCDFEAIYNAHAFANSCGQKVMGEANAVYRISPDNFTKSIPINTNVDFCGATFIVDDVGESAYRYRNLPLFELKRETDYRTILMSTMQELTGQMTVSIPRGTKSLSWLVPQLQSKSMLEITCSSHKDYIRHGANENAGSPRTDMVIINTDGTLADDTPVVFDFDMVTDIRIYRVDDKALTIENGIFKNICCRVVESTTYDKEIKNDDGTTTTITTTHANKYHSYKRGFGVYRSNVTFKNIDHEMLDEPGLGSYPEGCGYTPDEKHYGSNGNLAYGSRHESYPYYGFFLVDNVYNLNVKDSSLDGHTTYYEDKPATLSTGGSKPNPVPMGSYDFVLEYSCNVTFTNVVQKAETGLGDSKYWGIMSSNGSRNLTFEGCEINRFDAHKGFWNATLRNTTIGHSFNVIGGGTLIADGVTKVAGDTFISLRSDYGATFRGDMILKNCVVEAHPSYNTDKGGTYTAGKRTNNIYIIKSGFNIKNDGWSNDNSAGAYWLWDFGYTCYMPENITIENFQSYAKKKTYLFNDLPDVIFEKTYVEGQTPTKTTVKNSYQITKSITYVNMTPFTVCPGTTSAPSGMGTYTYNKLKSIPTSTIEKTDVEE